MVDSDISLPQVVVQTSGGAAGDGSINGNLTFIKAALFKVGAPIVTPSDTPSIQNGTDAPDSLVVTMALGKGFVLQTNPGGVLIGAVDNLTGANLNLGSLGAGDVTINSAQTGVLASFYGNSIELGVGGATNLITHAGTVFTYYNQNKTQGLGLVPIYGLDNRTGLTAADASAVTLYAVPAGGGVFCIGASADITTVLNAAGTYTITYTDVNGTTHTLVPLSAATAVGHYTVAPADSVRVNGSTNITAQLTGTFTSGDVDVAASVRQIA